MHLFADSALFGGSFEKRPGCVMETRLGMAFGGLETNATAMVEAEEVIREWLRGVERIEVASCQGTAEYSVTPSMDGVLLPQSNSSLLATTEDYLGSLDWSCGSVADNARTVVDSLLRKDLQKAGSARSTVRPRDPRVTMEMRHKKVKERRQLRDERHRKRMETQLLLKQAQREAEEEVRREEREARKKTAQEEKLIDLQVKLMRSQLRERQEETRQLAVQQRSIIEDEVRKSLGKRGTQEKRNGKEGLGDVLAASPVVQRAEELLDSERRRQCIRSELLKQLEEAKAQEAKVNIKLLHRSFSAWYEMVVLRRAKLGKVVAMREWRAMMRVWAGWRRFVKGRKAKRESEMVTREMQRRERVHQVAQEHYESHLLLRTLLAWRSAVRLAETHRQQLEEQQVHRRKMDALLRAAAAAMKSKDELVSPQQRPQTSSNHTEHIKQVRRALATATPSPGVVKLPAGRRMPEPAVWKVAQQQLVMAVVMHETAAGMDMPNRRIRAQELRKWAEEARLVSEVDKMAGEAVGEVEPQDEASNGGDALGEGVRSVTPIQQSAVQVKDITAVTSNGTTKALRKVKKPIPKPVTHPVPMKGMVSRSAVISERRAARERRREVMVREKAERLAKEEEEKKRAEREAREALVAQRKEERRLAKQHEMERLQKEQLQKELHDRAVGHHRISLLRNAGLLPWRKFMERCHVSRAAADQLHMQQLQRMAFGVWSRRWREVVAEKEARAQLLHKKILLRRTWKEWLKYVELSRDLTELAVGARPHLLVKKVFRAWCRVSKEGRMEVWEKMARARRFRLRFVQRQVLRAWSHYIPVVKEERAKEQRRTELRRKVSMWLSDFQPPPLPDDT